MSFRPAPRGENGRMNNRSASPMSFRSASDDSSGGSSSRRRGAGLLRSLRSRGSGGSGGKSDGVKIRDKKSFLDLLQIIRVQSASGDGATHIRDDVTTANSITPSLASTAHSSFASSGGFHRTPTTWSSEATKPRYQNGNLPSLSSTWTTASVSSTIASSRSNRFIGSHVRSFDSSRPPSTITPLYNAISSGAPRHVLENLLEEDPTAPTVQNNGGMTPLHCAIERYDTDTEVLMLLLASNPSAAGLRCGTGENSIHLLWQRFIEPADYRSERVKEKASLLRRKLEGIAHCAFAVHRQTRAEHALQENPDLSEFWHIMTAFIKAACHAPNSRSFTINDDTKMVHDCIAIDCHSLLIRFAAALHPFQIREPMYDHGQKCLPLHVAVTRSAETLKTVLQLDPQAGSRKDAEGRLPLHIALEFGKTWDEGIQELIQVSPMSIGAIDPRTGMLPVLQAAIFMDDRNLTTVFNILLANPMELMNRALRSY